LVLNGAIGIPKVRSTRQISFEHADLASIGDNEVLTLLQTHTPQLTE
jgi:hypothetical protein